jgi:hypothetical protein
MRDKENDVMGLHETTVKVTISPLISPLILKVLVESVDRVQGHCYSEACQVHVRRWEREA